ncbi:cache domain-containing sensor histidine kinase [Paenibacillus physcomitrellae]|uniref:Histidine kinase n=1 Tax=Paenibacillus physcomitrellae TaxID=1619311 RepID=A0ABQ1GG25_9BACL|nr:sensor histidine kinase [Paenibacillus physcomitrellae]GGA42933.1 histidine kinase [Paenibacillus physcomitrellae]
MRILNLFRSDRNFNFKLKTQLTASFLIMTLFIICLFSLFVYKSVLYILKNQSEELLVRQFRQSEYNIQNVRDQTEKVAELLTINKDLQSFVDNPSDQRADRINQANEVIKMMDGILGTYPYLYSISLYSKDGEALATTGSSSWYSTNQDEIPFYTSSLYRDITQKGIGLLWEGSYDSQQFETLNRIYAFKPSVPLITMARNVNVLGRSNRSAVLVFNIRQADFSPIFNGDWNLKGSQYLVDDQGRTVSSTEPEAINTVVRFADQIDRSRSYGSFMTKNNGQTTQVTYYRIGGTGWTLINETLETEFLRNISILRQVIITIMLVSIVLAFMLSTYWIYRITRPLTHLVRAMREMEMGKMGVVLDDTPRTELGVIGRRFNNMSLSIEQLIGENKKIEQGRRQLELEALQFQINPHFLYNALNTIKWIAIVRKETSIVEAITTLGNLVRSIYKENALFIPLEAELQYLHNYLKIMNTRYGEGVEVSFEVDERFFSYKIIRFILQPIVENAFVHGMSSIGYKGQITIGAEEKDGDLFITVHDNGQGLDADKLEDIHALLKMNSLSPNPKGSIGLSNVNRRIKMQHGDRYGISLHSQSEEGTTVLIHVPVVLNSGAKEEDCTESHK